MNLESRAERFPSGRLSRPESLLAIELAYIVTRRLAEKFTEDVNRYLEKPEEYTQEVHHQQDSDYEHIYKPSYEYLTAKLNSESAQNWYRSPEIDTVDYSKIQREDAALRRAHVKYYEASEKRKKRDFSSTLHHCVTLTQTITPLLQEYQESLKNPSSDAQLIGDGTENLSNQLKEAVSNYETLKNMNRHLAFSPAPYPSFTTIDTTDCKAKWAEWLSLEDDVTTIINTYNTDRTIGKK